MNIQKIILIIGLLLGGWNAALLSQESPVQTPTEKKELDASEEEINALLNETEAEEPDATAIAPSPEAVDSIEHSSYGIFGEPLADCSQAEDKLSIWTAFVLGIGGGLLALLFPCTFPMIPMTMSFFLKGADKAHGKRNAIFYGFCIFLVFFLLSLPFNFGLSGDALNNFSTNVWVNLAFFLIFLFFAFSLFGFYDISLPSSFANKIDSQSNTGSMLGIFFMAFTLAVVSFSCTGPILGAVLGSVKNAKYITPAFSGFGIGMGVPFALFALFPQVLKNLPKSGSWMDVLKTVFGFIEVAFAFKFLSNADLVLRWGLLKREPFVIIWMIIALLMGLYLIGLFRFKKNSTIKKTPITWLLAILSFGFVGYLATDFFRGNLEHISGFPPPKEYSIRGYKPHFETHMNGYEAALALAKKENKPLLIDFTGHACVNCRRMEENVWVDPQVYEIMKNKFVITSLYVDQKTELPKEQQVHSALLDRVLVTEGDKWTEMQAKNLYQYTQPQYAIIDPKTERIINKPIGGFNDVSIFKDFLDCGLKYMQKK